MEKQQKNSYEKVPSVSAIIIRQSDGKIFLGQRSYSKKWSPGKWETIGGRTRRKETVEKGLSREVKEELNVDIKSLEYFKDYSYDDRKFKTYIIELAEGPKPNKNDFENWGWFNLREIKKMNFAINCKERIIDYYESYKNKRQK